MFNSDKELTNALDYCKSTGLQTVQNQAYTSKVDGRVGQTQQAAGPGKIPGYQAIDDLDFDNIANLVSQGSIVIVTIKQDPLLFFDNESVKITRRDSDTANYGILPLLVS